MSKVVDSISARKYILRRTHRLRAKSRHEGGELENGGEEEGNQEEGHEEEGKEEVGGVGWW
ncbi:MAG: hypothetical protein ACKVU1_18665 [bacterium]